MCQVTSVDPLLLLSLKNAVKECFQLASSRTVLINTMLPTVPTICI